MIDIPDKLNELGLGNPMIEKHEDGVIVYVKTSRSSGELWLEEIKDIRDELGSDEVKIEDYEMSDRETYTKLYFLNSEDMIEAEGLSEE